MSKKSLRSFFFLLSFLVLSAAILCFFLFDRVLGLFFAVAGLYPLILCFGVRNDD